MEGEPHIQYAKLNLNVQSYIETPEWRLSRHNDQPVKSTWRKNERAKEGRRTVPRSGALRVDLDDQHSIQIRVFAQIVTSKPRVMSFLAWLGSRCCRSQYRMHMRRTLDEYTERHLFCVLTKSCHQETD